VLKALPQRTGQAINTFLTNANQRLSRTVESIASGAKRIGSDIRDKIQLAGQTLVNLTKTTATTTAPITSINASAGKLNDVDTAQVNQKLKEADVALKLLLPSTLASSAEPGNAASIQAAPAKKSDVIGLKDGVTRDFLFDLPRAEYFWESESGEQTSILDNSAYKDAPDGTARTAVLKVATDNLKKFSLGAGVDEGTLLRASNQAHQGIIGILGSVLQESADSPLKLKHDVQGVNTDGVSDTLPAESKGTLTGGSLNNKYILSSDGAGGIKVIATSTKTNCEFFTTPTSDPFELDPEQSSTTLKVEFVVPKEGLPRLTNASYACNLKFITA
jgi:hypothetical protein